MSVITRYINLRLLLLLRLQIYIQEKLDVWLFISLDLMFHPTPIFLIVDFLKRYFMRFEEFIYMYMLFFLSLYEDVTLCSVLVCC